MSVDYIISLNLLAKRTSILTSKNIISLLLKKNWNLYSTDNKIIYTDVGDVGDVDDYVYIANNLSIEDYFKIVEIKEKNYEIIAFAAFFLDKKNVYRINVMICPDLTVIISPDDRTKKLLGKGYKILDISWYLEKIIPCFESEKIGVESFSFSQHY